MESEEWKVEWKVEKVEWTNDVAAGSVDLKCGEKKELCQVAPCYMIAAFISSLGLVPINTWRVKSGKWSGKWRKWSGQMMWLLAPSI